MFHDNVGHVVAQYKTIQKYLTKETKMALQITANPVKPFGISSLCAQLPSTIIQAGDTWESVSQRLFGDPSLSAIVSAYSGVSLTPGLHIETMQMINVFNKAGDYTPYSQLMGAIYNSLYPNLHTPQAPPPHHSFWDEVLSIVISIVVMAVIPALAGEILGAMGPILESMVFGVAGTIADAASQGIAITFGEQHGFSLGEMLENGMAAGLTAGISKQLNISKMLSNSEYPKAFAAEATIGVTVQLFQMSVGLRKKLDIAQIIEQATATIATAKINNSKAMRHVPTVVAHAADELTESAIGAAVGQQPDLTALAANTLGDEAADGADVLAEHVRSHLSHLSAHVDENEDTHAEPPALPTSYHESVRSTHVDDVFNRGNRQKDAYQQFEDDMLKAQEDEMMKSMGEANEARVHEIDEMLRGHERARSEVSRTSWWQRTELASKEMYFYAKDEVNLGIHHPLESAFGIVKGAANLSLDLLDFVTGSTGMQPQLSITPAQRFGADLVNGASFFVGGAALREAKAISRAEVIAAETSNLSMQLDIPALSDTKGVRFFGTAGAEKILTPEEQLHTALNDSKIYKRLSQIHADNPNAASALRRKLSVLQDFQNNADRVETRSNGSIRYYDTFRPAKTLGPTTGSRFVIEYNPLTRDVTSWNETYNSLGNVNRIHIKSINGFEITSPHFPPTLKEQLEFWNLNIPFRSGF